MRSTATNTRRPFSIFHCFFQLNQLPLCLPVLLLTFGFSFNTTSHYAENLFMRLLSLHIRLISMWIRLHDILLLRSVFFLCRRFFHQFVSSWAIFSFVSKRGGLLLCLLKLKPNEGAKESKPALIRLNCSPTLIRFSLWFEHVRWISFDWFMIDISHFYLILF